MPKFRIIKHRDQFVIQQKRLFGAWQILTAKREWSKFLLMIDTTDYEFFHYKFDTLQDAEDFMIKRIEIGRDAWIAFNPNDVIVMREYNE